MAKIELHLRDMRATTIYGLLARNKDNRSYLELMESKAFEKPSDNLLREVFIHFYTRKRNDVETEMLSHACHWIAWDHTFWISKLVHNDKNSPFKGYFIVMNQVICLRHIVSLQNTFHYLFLGS